jgi:hypothetical protein
MHSTILDHTALDRGDDDFNDLELVGVQSCQSRH